MKIILVGASGAVGQSVIQRLGNRHEIIQVGGSGGDIQKVLLRVR